MEIIELIIDCVPYVLSIIATFAAFKKNKKTLTAEEIEAKAEAKKQKILNKLNKKNHIKSDFQIEDTKIVETIVEDTTSGISTF